MKRFFIVGIVTLFVLFCFGLFVRSMIDKSKTSDKDELRDSEYVTGTSDKFEDGYGGNSEKESHNSNKNENNDNVGITNDGNTNGVTVEQDKEDNKDNNKDEESDGHKEDEEWSPFY